MQRVSEQYPWMNSERTPPVHCSLNVHCHFCLCSEAEHHSHLGNLRCICDVNYTARKLVFREHCSVTMCSMLGEILKEGLVHFHGESQSNHLRLHTKKLKDGFERYHRRPGNFSPVDSGSLSVFISKLIHANITLMQYFKSHSYVLLSTTNGKLQHATSGT
jgi:hypothetical protein